MVFWIGNFWDTQSFFWLKLLRNISHFYISDYLKVFPFWKWEFKSMLVLIHSWPTLSFTHVPINGMHNVTILAMECYTTSYDLVQGILYHTGLVLVCSKNWYAILEHTNTAIPYRIMYRHCNGILLVQGLLSRQQNFYSALVTIFLVVSPILVNNMIVEEAHSVWAFCQVQVTCNMLSCSVSFTQKSSSSFLSFLSNPPPLPNKHTHTHTCLCMCALVDTSILSIFQW